MKILILTEYYPIYLNYFYKKNPLVVDLSFEEHRNKIMDDHFSWEGDLSRYMNRQGIQSQLIILNAESLQKKWAKENNFNFSKNGWKKEIAMEQIKHFRPDIIWLDSIFTFFGDFVISANQYCKKVITWVSCVTPENLDVSGIKSLITSHPVMLKDKQYLFDEVIVTYPGFNREILTKIGHVEIKYDFTFIGGISLAHSKRAEILAYLIKNGINLKVFGYLQEERLSTAIKKATKYFLNCDINKGINALKQAFVKTDYQRNVEIIKSVHQGPIFGLDMYRALAASRITLNYHIDIADNHAGNMRMFEATGVGTCLLSEHSSNILFEPGEEIITFKSKEELLEILKKMRNQTEKIEQIAKKGQKRTLEKHNIERMFNDIQPALIYK